jgi:hypothetical protein
MILVYSNYIFKSDYWLQVKNNNLLPNSLRMKLNVIKITCDKLFAFTDVKLEYLTFTRIQDDAAFLFANITALSVNIDKTSYYEDKSGHLKNVVDAFDRVGRIKLITLIFPYKRNPLLNKLDREMLPRIGGICLTGLKIWQQVNPLDYLLLCGASDDVNERLAPGTILLSALTDLKLYDCVIDNIDRLATYCPRLENLHIHLNEQYEPIRPFNLTNDPFRAMNHMRELKLDKVAVHSFDIIDGGCMPLLEELYIRFADGLNLLTRVDSFPAFPKLTKLRLRLLKVKWIDPKAFDHLTELTRFEIECTELECDTFETGVVARIMIFHVKCKAVKLTSNSVSEIEEIRLQNQNEVEKTRLETLVPLSGLKRLTACRWADADLPFYQMTNLEFLKLETINLSIAKCDQLKLLSKLKVVEVKNAFEKSEFFYSYIQWWAFNVFLTI